MRSTADIVIIGAGAHGAGLAYHLARAGAGSIVVLEKKFVASGPTAKSGALIRPMFAHEVYIKLVLEATAMFEQWDEVVGGDAGFVQKGFFRIANSLERTHLGGDLDLMRKLQVPFELVSNELLADYAPTSNFRGDEVGLMLPKGGYADPIRTTVALANAAKRLGADVVEGVSVTGITVEHGRIVSVETTEGSIGTRLVVNCAGSWCDRVAALVGVELPIEIHRNPTCLFSRPPAIDDDCPILSDGVNKVYVRTVGDSIVRSAHFSWAPDLVDPDDYDETINRETLQGLRDKVDRRCAAMRRSVSAGGFSAIYDMMPDCHPIVGKVSDIDGFWCNCGWSGNGFASSPAVGRCLAAKIVGGESDIDLSEFEWPRPTGATARPESEWTYR